ncbi:Uncharacterised protein [Vibrio cholerae]|nr:Uncharacterised protein [Vibrio cholerae]CSC94436.1 Uncharacterised protein [Vibrio cholerae]CSE04466.1 Uncharacterised protein [Vibrio cholerae]
MVRGVQKLNVSNVSSKAVILCSCKCKSNSMIWHLKSMNYGARLKKTTMTCSKCCSVKGSCL